jgi:cytochrome c peroxidase
MATAQGLREVFGRMGFGDRDIVALSGCHALGRCHPGVSGYNGVWTLTPRTFNNDYFSQLAELKWQVNATAKKLQYQGKQASILSTLYSTLDWDFPPITVY